jgi:uncharacterized protein YaaR (DUF327 family)
MTEFELLTKQLDDKVGQLKDAVANGNLEYVEYKKTCGEIRGLLIARGYILDLKERLENSNE